MPRSNTPSIASSRSSEYSFVQTLDPTSPPPRAHTTGFFGVFKRNTCRCLTSATEILLDGLSIDQWKLLAHVNKDMLDESLEELENKEKQLKTHQEEINELNAQLEATRSSDSKDINKDFENIIARCNKAMMQLMEKYNREREDKAKYESLVASEKEEKANLHSQLRAKDSEIEMLREKLKNIDASTKDNVEVKCLEDETMDLDTDNAENDETKLTENTRKGMSTCSAEYFFQGEDMMSLFNEDYQNPTWVS